MKQSIKLFIFSFVALAMFGFSNGAQAAFNENKSGTDCSVAGIAIAGQPLQRGCAAYQDQLYATYGQVVDVNLYYRNTSSTDAQNARGTIAVVGGANGYTFTNSITSSVGGAGPKSVYLTLPSDAELEFNGAKVYQRRMAAPENQTVMSQISTASNLNSFPLGNNGTVESYLKCQQFGDSFCYQGFVVATFTVVKEQKAQQTCTDPSALNYGGALPCTYYQQPQKCTDPSAINYGGTLPCNYYNPPQLCTDPTALNYGSALPCIPKPIVQQCYINYFNASPNQITAGGNSVLNWSTTGCTTAQIYPTLGSVNVNGSQYVSPASSTLYTLNAYGPNSTSATTVVTVGQVSKPVCSDNIDNDGDGKIDVNDPGCFDGNIYNANKMSEYNVVVISNVGPTASSLSATNITSSTCRLNGIVRVNDASPTSAYFKYGTSASNLIYTTKQDSVSGTTGSYQFSDTLTSLNPSTTYYYKIVATNGYGTKEGETRSCTTRSNTVVNVVTTPPVTRTVVRPIVTTVVPEERIIANSAPSLLFLRIDDRREDLTCSDVVDYQVVYKNVSSITLDRAVLEVQLPAGVNYVKSSGGGTYSEATKTVTFNIGTIMPNQEDAKFIQGDVNCLMVDSDMLVANASMSYTNPQTTAQEEAVAYDLDRFFAGTEVNGRTALTGAAIFGAGFLPNSLLGWLIIIVVILGLIYLIRLFLMPVSNPNKKTERTISTHSSTEVSDTH